MDEIWMPVARDIRYDVSNLGRIRNAKSGRFLKPDHDRGGYPRITLGNRGKHVFIHWLVAETFIGQPPSDGMQVNHRDGVRTNNRFDNLEYLTCKENHAHSWKELGRRPPHMGEQTHFAKLSDADVIEIRRLRSERFTYKDIASRFNTKPANVWHICIGRTWKHLLTRQSKNYPS